MSKLGVHKTERFLPVSSAVTVIGQLSETIASSSGGGTPLASTRPSAVGLVLRRPIADNGPFIITPMLEQLQDSMTRAARAYKVRA